MRPPLLPAAYALFSPMNLHLLTTPAEMEAVEDVTRLVWPGSETDVVPAHLLITLAHNGNLTNVEQLAKEIYESDLRHVNTSSDSEVLLNVFAHELAQRGKLQPTEEDVFAAVTDVHNRCVGGYAVVAMVTGYGIVGFRDPHGIRCGSREYSERSRPYRRAGGKTGSRHGFG